MRRLFGRVVEWPVPICVGGKCVPAMPASRIIRVAIVGLALALIAPSFNILAASGATHNLWSVPMANASWTILETSGIQCTFDVDSDPPTGDCVSNNGNVRVIKTAVSQSANGELEVDLVVENVGAFRLATADGVTPNSAGVRVFISSGPFPTAGSGDVAVLNADGSGSADTLGKPYFQYSGSLLGNDGILSPGETSGAKTWRLSVGPDVSQVDVSLGVAAEVPDSETSTPTPAPTLMATDTPTPSATLTDTPSPTPTETPTSSPTASPTSTSTPTSSSTPTSTIPPTSTPTKTVIPSATATDTSATTPTRTPEATRTPKPTKPARSRD
jgi:hypothetical protein